MSTRRASGAGDGTPIEHAPFWALVLVMIVLWLIAFPAVVGLLHGFGAWHGVALWPAVAAGVLAVTLTTGLATRRPWSRAASDDGVDRRPPFVRLSTWLVTVVLYPNILMGVILLTRKGPPPDYAATAALGLLLAGVQGLLGCIERRRSRKLGSRAQ